MFVMKSDYDELAQKYLNLLAQWNDLIDRINEKGGEEFLNASPEQQFDAIDVQKLISLCHPDKHDGKPISEEMTKKLLAIKEQLS